MTNPLQLATLSLTVALSAYFGPILFASLAPHIQPWFDLLPISQGSTSLQCAPHSYTTTLISLSPLVIYIHNFISPAEASALVELGVPLLQPSPITGYGSDTQNTQHRTSWSAPLPVNNSLVDCILARSEAFMGTLLLAGRDNMGQAQLVRYTEGQKFGLHHDWFSRPRLLDEDAKIGRRRLYNRIATIFLTLQADNITEDTGETWFPHVKPITSSGEKHPWWREHEDGGMAFKAIPGNAIFWVNMFPNNGSGDGRTLHAGLPVKGGVKTAMNIWPRVFFGPDA
ncbi:hypothetical protein V8F20_002738 [Naviculisporaceae sp. PSN 640]